MSNYTVLTNYAAKDGLVSGNPAKLVKGADFTAEFNAVQTALNSKVDGTVVGFPDNAFFANNSTTAITNTSGALGLMVGGINRLSVTTAGDSQITIDGGSTYNSVGFRNQPANGQSTNYTLVKADVGKNVQMGVTGQTITVPNAVFAVGDIINLSCFLGGGAGTVTIAQGAGLTLYFVNGTSATTGNRTLTSVGEAQVRFLSSSVAIVKNLGGLT